MTKGVLNHQKIWFYHEPIFYHEKKYFAMNNGDFITRKLL
jgi:hypothetical protein